VYLDQAMDKVVPHIVPDPVVTQLHAVAVLGVQEVLVGVAARIATTPHIAAHCQHIDRHWLKAMLPPTTALTF